MSNSGKIPNLRREPEPYQTGDRIATQTAAGDWVEMVNINVKDNQLQRETPTGSFLTPILSYWPDTDQAYDEDSLGWLGTPDGRGIVLEVEFGGGQRVTQENAPLIYHPGRGQATAAQEGQEIKPTADGRLWVLSLLLLVTAAVLLAGWLMVRGS